MEKVSIIKDTTVAPYRSVCRLQTQRVSTGLKRNFTSTAFFIGRNLLLTAGHNVFSGAFSKVTYFALTPAINGAVMPFGDLSVSGVEVSAAVHCHPSYRMGHRNVKRRQFDLAAIVLPDHALMQLKGWQFHQDFVVDKQVQPEKGERIFSAGYPAEGLLHPSFDGSILALDNSVVHGFDRNFLFHDLDTETGNSGSPVWVERDGKRIVVAIHTFGGGATMLSDADHERIALLLRTA
jgi:V8-like Glu-specific endopeptidase